jgi:phosphoribosyl-ATP pyrophosphohydrolase
MTASSRAPDVRFGADGPRARDRPGRRRRPRADARLDGRRGAGTHTEGVRSISFRTRDRLWRKGETRRTMRLVRSTVDLRRRRALVTVDPSGRRPRHTAAASTPEARPPSRPPGLRLARELWATIASRATRAAKARTRRAARGRRRRRGRKVTEEATEVLIAAKETRRRRSATERTRTPRGRAGRRDRRLLYHALVLPGRARVRPPTVIDVLRGRHAG